MRRTFDLLTRALADGERVVVSGNVSWKEPTSFRIIVAPSVAKWFETSVAIFYASRFSFSVRRIGQCQSGVRFSALVECMTNDRASQRSELTSCYWPPPDSMLFQPVAHSTVERTEREPADSAATAERERPALPLFFNPLSPVTFSGLRVFLNDRGWPLAAIAEGPVVEDEERRGLYVPFEFPVPLAMPKQKPGVEWIHFAAARFDTRRAGSDLLEGDASFGGDPPDFVLKRPVEAAVELAQFTIADRRHALALARGFRNALEVHEHARVSHLRGHLVMFGFDTPRGLPPRPSDAEEVARAIEQLEQAAASVTPQSVGGDLRNGFVVKIVNAPLGGGAIGVFPLSSIPQTQLGTAHGFELATSYTTLTRVNDTERILATLVSDHDRAGNDILLLSAGAPGISGLSLVADEIAVEPNLIEYMQLPSPRHLKRVILHRWNFGDVYELFPTLRCIASPLVSLAEGGVVILPTRDTIPDAWTSTCPCGSGQVFARCHGA